MKAFVLCLLMTLAISAAPMALSAQPSAKEVKFMQLLCRGWHTYQYEQNGVQGPPAPDQANDKLVFYKDFRVLSVEHGNQQWGTWVHDPVKETLTMTDKNTKHTYTVKILQLTNTSMVLAYTDRLGNKLKFFMKAI